MPSHFGHVRLFATPWTVAHQAPLSVGFSWPECWSGLQFPPPGDLPDSGIEPVSPLSSALQADSLVLSHWGSPILYERWWLFVLNLKMSKKLLSLSEYTSEERYNNCC